MKEKIVSVDDLEWIEEAEKILIQQAFLLKYNTRKTTYVTEYNLIDFNLPYDNFKKIN